MEKKEIAVEQLTKDYKIREQELVQNFNLCSTFVNSEEKYKTFTDQLYKLRQEYELSLRKLLVDE